MADALRPVSRHKGSGGVSIRRATPADADELRALYQDVYEGRYPLSIIYDVHETVSALGRDNILWLTAEAKGRLVASVIFTVDKENKLAKVFGAVVKKTHRGRGLTEQAIRLGLHHLVEETAQAESVYATARTLSPAPQKLLRNLGFKELGIFPNVRKVENYETHCLTAYFKPGALGRRMARPRLPSALKPFFSVVRRATGIEEPEFNDTPLEPSSPYAGGWIPFEIIEAPEFVLERWKSRRSANQLKMQFFPFHEPNLLLVSPDQSTEVYLHHSKPDHHAVIVGGHENVPDLTHLLNSVVMSLEEHGVRYLELLADAYHPRVLKSIMDARFLPSAYYPAMRWRRGRGRDYIVFSKSFVVLDFRNILAEGFYREYLREYFNLWKALYVEGF